ncbi:MAG: TVP38/TMEM64 family protein [Syntrophaceae bacterium]|nr:TVP38/TMEM64 family protein [Syntrophaceae bacterium]
MEDYPIVKKSNNVWKPVLFTILLAVVIIIFRLTGWSEKVTDLRDWISALGIWGPFVFVLLYVVAVIAAVPGAAITIAGGTLFGSAWGVVLVSIASTIGASITFLIARYLARDFVLRKLSTNETFRKLDRLTLEHGAVIVAITRLVPLFPFNILNYGFGLTAVSFRIYIFWSWLCMLPGTILYVVGTDAIVSTITSGKVPWLLVIVIVVAGFVLAFLIRMAKNKLKQGRQINID